MTKVKNCCTITFKLIKKYLPLYKIPTGLYHKGSVHYSSNSGCVGSMIAIVFLIVYFSINLSSLTSVTSINVFNDNIDYIRIANNTIEEFNQSLLTNENLPSLKNSVNLTVFPINFFAFDSN